MEYTGELYQLGSVYRHFVLKKDAVIRRRSNTGSEKSYYLCAIVLFDISKDSDVVNSHELLPRDVTDQQQHTNAEERMWKRRVKGKTRGGGAATRIRNWGTHVYGDALPSESTRSAYTMNIIFTISAYQAAAK